MCDRRHRESPNNPPPRNDQAEEHARFVVMQHLTAGTISHAELLRMHDSGGGGGDAVLGTA
jgi:hypothetical protein